MSTTLIELNRADEAIECLQNILRRVSCPKLRFVLAKAFSSQSRYYDALEQLNTCIGLQRGKPDPEAMKVSRSNPSHPMPMLQSILIAGERANREYFERREQWQLSRRGRRSR